MNYIEAKAKKEELYAEVDRANAALQQFPKGPMGLTPDDVKMSHEFIKAKFEFEVAFTRVRVFNQFVSRVFKQELKADIRARYGKVREPS